MSGLIDWLNTLLRGDQQQSVDTDYLRSEANYKWIEVPDEGEARCNVCGKLFAVSEMPKVIRHVAEHDGQGAAEIDPTEQAVKVAEMNYSDLLTVEEQENHSE
jgi:hypothetical protein